MIKRKRGSFGGGYAVQPNLLRHTLGRVLISLRLAMHMMAFAKIQCDE